MLRRSAPLARQAWERVGRTPGPEVFAQAGTPDLRGKPHWEIDTWAL